MFVRENISCTLRLDFSASIDCDGNCESFFIEISKHFKNKDIVGCIYRAPYNDMKVFNDNFDVLLQNLNNEHVSCFIAGDYNINLWNNNIHSDTTTFNIFSQLFFPAISKPTRFSNNKSTLIDNIILNFLSGN